MTLSVFSNKRLPVKSNDIFSLQSGINKIFDDFFNDFPIIKSDFLKHNQPKIDISETDKSLEISAELAGIKKENIDISFSNGYLIIKGEKKSEKEEEGKNFYINERSYGSFKRVIDIGENFNIEQSNAEFLDGVLKLSIPKIEEKQIKVNKINIK